MVMPQWFDDVAQTRFRRLLPATSFRFQSQAGRPGPAGDRRGERSGYLGCVYPVSTVDRPQRTRRNDALTRKNIAKLLLGRVDIVVSQR